MSGAPLPFGADDLLTDGFDHLQRYLLLASPSSSQSDPSLLADTTATHAKWAAACEMCVATGAVAPLVELILVRASDPDGRRGVDEEGDGNFVVKDEMFVTRWLRGAVAGCRDNALALETLIVAASPSELEAGCLPRYTALDVRCGHVFSLLRALLVRVRWQVVLQAEFRLSFDPNLSDKAVLGSVAVDGSRTRICDILSTAMALSYESLITTSVDAVVESNDALQALRSSLLDRVAAIRAELVSIKQEGQRATDVYNQRRSLLDATRNVAAQQGQDTSDVDASSADLDRQFERYNNIGRARQDILAKLLRYTEVELQLSSWMLAMHHLRRRISCGRWLVDTCVRQHHNHPDRPLVCDMRKFAASMASLRDAASESSPLFWDGVWTRLRTALARASTTTSTTAAGGAADVVDTVPESLLSLVDAGTADVRTLVTDGERTQSAADGVAASSTIAAAFEAHHAALAAVLYSVVAQLVAPAHDSGATAVPAGTLRSCIHGAVTGFSRVLGGAIEAQSVQVVALLDSACAQLPAQSWLTDWAVDVVCTPPFSWNLPRDPTTAVGDASPFGTNGGFGRRLLHLRRADIVVTSHRCLWASHTRLTPPTALVVVEALLECDRWVEAVGVARGVPGQQDRLLSECFRWFARGRWKQLLSLPLTDTEAALLERELGSLADSEPALRTRDLRLVYRMHRLKPIDDLQTSGAKRRLGGGGVSDGDGDGSTRLKDVLGHYMARCAAPVGDSGGGGGGEGAGDGAGAGAGDHGAADDSEAALRTASLPSAVPTDMAARLRQWRLRRLQTSEGVGTGTGAADDAGVDGGEGDEEMKADGGGMLDMTPVAASAAASAAAFAGVPPSTPVMARHPPSVMDMSFLPSTASPAGKPSASGLGASGSFPVPSWAGDLSSFEHRTATKANRAPGTPVTATFGLPPPGSRPTAAPPRPPVSFRSPVAPRRFYPSSSIRR